MSQRTERYDGDSPCRVAMARPSQHPYSKPRETFTKRTSMKAPARANSLRYPSRPKSSLERGQPLPDCVLRELGDRPEAQLVHNLAPVAIDRRGGDAEASGNFLGRLAF